MIDAPRGQRDSLCGFESAQFRGNGFAFAQLTHTPFIAIDVETANSTISSICQIAVVSFSESRIVDTWQSLINPDVYFEPFNVSLHGIDQVAVDNAPRFPDILATLSALLTGAIVASHMPFDRIALERVCLKYRLPLMECTWIDTARVCRRAWPQFARRGYGLKSIASWRGIDFTHHNAFEDARAAGSILAQVVAETGVDVPEWIARMKPASSHEDRSAHSRTRWKRRRATARNGTPTIRPSGSVVAL